MSKVIYIPTNNVIEEYGYFLLNDICKLLKKYKDNSEAVSFIADMLEK